MTPQMEKDPIALSHERGPAAEGDRAPETRRMGQVAITTKLLAGMLGLDGATILAVTQTADERLLGVFRVIVVSPKLSEVLEGAAPPIVALASVQ
jgi:hypothetical protein